MTNPAAIASAKILKLVSEGVDIIAAMQAVCGVEATNTMIANVYSELRSKAVR